MSQHSSNRNGLAGWALVNKDGEMERSDDGSMMSGSSEEVVNFEPDQVSYHHLHKDRSVSVESEDQSRAGNEGVNDVDTSSASPDAVVMETPPSAGDLHNSSSDHQHFDDPSMCTTIEKTTDNDALSLDQKEAGIDVVDGLAADSEEPSGLDQPAGLEARLLDSALQRMETSMTDSDCDFIRLEPDCIEEDDQSDVDEPSSVMSSSSVSSKFNFLADDDAATSVEPHSNLKTDSTENRCVSNKPAQTSEGDPPVITAATSSTFEDEYQQRLFLFIKIAIVVTTVVIIGITGHFIGLYFTGNGCGNIFFDTQINRYEDGYCPTCIGDLNEDHQMLMNKGAMYDHLESVNFELLNEINQLNIMLEDLQADVAKSRYQLSPEVSTLKRKNLEDRRNLRDKLNVLEVENLDLRIEIGQLRYSVPPMVQGQKEAGDDVKLIGHKYCDKDKQKEENQQINKLTKELNASRNQSEMWQKLYSTEHAQRMNTSQHNATMDFFTCVTVLAPLFNVSGFLKYLNYTAIQNVTESLVETLRGYEYLRKTADTMAAHAENITGDLYEDLQHVMSEAESLFSDVHAATGDIYTNVKDVVAEATSNIKRFFSSDVPETKDERETKQKFKMDAAEPSRGKDDKDRNAGPDERKFDREDKKNKNNRDQKKEKRESVWRKGVKNILRDTKESVSRLGDHIEDAWDTMLSVSHYFWHKNSKALVKFQDKVSRNIKKFRTKITEKIHEKASKLFSKQTREERKKQRGPEDDDDQRHPDFQDKFNGRHHSDDTHNKRNNNKDGQQEENDQSHGHRHRRNNNRDWEKRDDSLNHRRSDCNEIKSTESSVQNAAGENKSEEKESADWYFKQKTAANEPSGQWYFKHKTVADESSGEWYFKHKPEQDEVSGQWYFKHKTARNEPSGQWYFKHKPAADQPSGQWYFKKSRDYHENYMDESTSGEWYFRSKNQNDVPDDTWYIQQMEHRRQYHENYMDKTRNGDWYFKGEKKNGEPRYNQQTEYGNNKETKGGEPTDSDDWLFARAESRQFKREIPGDD